jgi:hypothetical protein
VGPEVSRQWLHSIFAASFVRERMMGRSGVDTARRRELFMQSLHAVNTTGTTMMLSYCLNTNDAVTTPQPLFRSPAPAPAPAPGLAPALAPSPAPPMRPPHAA